MASPAAPSKAADQQVALKVSFFGLTTRTKLPLRDMVPEVLEQRIRELLSIPENVEVKIERYSDSNSKFVVLARNDTAIWKQLYRAAKAKSKLKLRVSMIGNPQLVDTSIPKPAATAPKPVAVEDVPETPAPHPAAVPGPPVMPIETVSAPPSEPPKAATPSIDYISFEAPTKQPAAPGRKPLTIQEIMCEPFSQAAKPAQPIANMPATGTLPYCSKSYNAGDYRTTFAGPLEPASGPTSPTPMSSQPSKPVQQPVRPMQPTQPVPPTQAIPAMLPSYKVESMTRPFAICCNNCEKTIPNVHFHCSTCDDGDFDLCETCRAKGVACHSDSHWLIRRYLSNGHIISSSTETMPSKRKSHGDFFSTQTPNNQTFPFASPSKTVAAPFDPARSVSEKPSETSFRPNPTYSTARRTCNCCIEEHPETEFLHCNDCEDFDLCKACFRKDGHGHHPKHSFKAAVAGVSLPESIRSRLTPGRNRAHNAICDGCDKYITGIRHKCLNCPDWDYCDKCVGSAETVHPKHRFVPIYEPLGDFVSHQTSQPVHSGICCDGPLCATGKGYSSYIRGIRYKCAVCNDIDFCGNCEASPSNKHNKTHPLIQFKTPVRDVNVTTFGQQHNGQPMPRMGDRFNARAPEAKEPVAKNTVNTVQTVVDVKPAAASEQIKKAKDDDKVTFVASSLRNMRISEPAETSPTPVGDDLGKDDLRAVYVSDTTPDGAIKLPNLVFKHTWTLTNNGTTAWPAGSSVRFVGGDYMGRCDPARSTPVKELMAASESTSCKTEVAPGAEYSFTVELRSPKSPGRYISNWRLCTPDNFKFGHRLWCDINVRTFTDHSATTAKFESQLESLKQKYEVLMQASSKMMEDNQAKYFEAASKALADRKSVMEAMAAAEKAKAVATQPEPIKQTELVKEAEAVKETEGPLKTSTMIFPKLDKESPSTSIHQEAPAEPKEAEVNESIKDEQKAEESDAFEDCEDADWDESDEGFMTDEEYDILDASDEEFLEQQGQK